MLSDEQLTVIFKVASREPDGYEPPDADLPDCEHLVEAGILRRVMSEGEPVYFAADEFKHKAMKLAQHQLAAAEQAELN